MYIRIVSMCVTVSLPEADDGVIWEYAKQKGFTIVSKDSDFQQ